MIVAENFGFVVGIDTHAKTHTLAIIDTASGGEIANETFPATATGGNRALSWILPRAGASNTNAADAPISGAGVLSAGTTPMRRGSAPLRGISPAAPRAAFQAQGGWSPGEPAEMTTVAGGGYSGPFPLHLRAGSWS